MSVAQEVSQNIVLILTDASMLFIRQQGEAMAHGIWHLGIAAVTKVEMLFDFLFTAYQDQQTGRSYS